MANRISWLTRVAVKLGIPLVVTAEDIPYHGATIPQISQHFPEGTIEHNKEPFGLTGDGEILSAVEATGRNTAVVVGLETDVCVAQSVLGLLERSYRVVVLSDATGSPGPGHKQGIERMRNAGAVISTVKGTFYEWNRTVPRVAENFLGEVENFYSGSSPEGVYL